MFVSFKGTVPAVSGRSQLVYYRFRVRSSCVLNAKRLFSKLFIKKRLKSEQNTLREKTGYEQNREGYIYGMLFRLAGIPSRQFFNFIL